jgi:hypothetical protein
MATRTAGLVPRTGQWNGVYVGTDLETRTVRLAMNRRGARLSGEMTIVLDPATGASGTARFTGSYAAAKVNLTITIPRTRYRPRAEMKLTGRLTAVEDGNQAIVAVTAPARVDQGGSIRGIPLNGAMVLSTAETEIREEMAFAAEDGGAWVDPGTGN